jgi:predicted MPP superfamily phosphohydrolase
MQKPKLTRREFLKLIGKFFAGLTAASVVGRGYTFLETKWVEYNHITLKIPKLPPAFDGYKIVHLTDIHIDEHISPEYTEEIVKKVNEFKPDLIAITGDVIDKVTPESFDPLISEVLSKLVAKDLVCVSPGNHDHWISIERFHQIISEADLTLLENKITTIQRRNQSVQICGIDSWMIGKDRIEEITPQLSEDGCAILLVHEPGFANISAQTGLFSLQLSGHTHGGLVKVPFYGPIYIPRHGRQYPEGLYHINDMYLYTNRGVGTGFFHLRFNCRPEVAIFTLENGTNST